MYIKFNVETEVRKFIAGEPTEVSPEVLLHILGEKYLAAQIPGDRKVG